MNKLLICGAVLGLVSVIMGALGDHGFDLTPEKSESLATAIRYNMLYAVLITALALSQQKKLFISGAVFAVGTTLFSFSIYFALITGIQQFTYITPFGGVLIIAGWLFLPVQAGLLARST